MSKQTHKVICVRCPKGCRLKVTVSKGENMEVEGYGCALGKEYGKEEVQNPQRIVPTTVRIYKARYPRLPVRTEESVPRGKIKEVIAAVKGVTVQAPVKKKATIIENVAGTGVAIIAEEKMERVKK